MEKSKQSKITYEQRDVYQEYYKNKQYLGYKIYLMPHEVKIIFLKTLKHAAFTRNVFPPNDLKTVEYKLSSLLRHLCLQS